MKSKLETFLNIIRDEGVPQAILAAGGDTLPSPLRQHCTFTKYYLNEHENGPEGLRPQFNLWRRGYVPKSASLYDFDQYENNMFLTDLQEEFSWGINSPYEHLLNNKQKFYEIVDSYGYDQYLPKRYGHLSNGSVTGSRSNIIELLKQESELVIKSQEGAAGNGVYLCKYREDKRQYLINGNIYSDTEFRNKVSNLDDHLVTEYIKQNEYIKTIYPRTPNTIRILTMRMSDNDIIIPRAVQRIGVDSGATVDNFSKGGLSSLIKKDGALSPAVQYINGDVRWHKTHPDTDSQIAGISVPGWEDIQRTIKIIAEEISEFTYVGWDLIITENGEFKIIEGNANSDTDLLQAHGPLLQDKKVETFYRDHDILS